MTVPDLIQRLPHLREVFPQELVMEWSAAEVLRAEHNNVPPRGRVKRVAAVY
jgi:hypothetical protein